jgi:hypothetical protein
MKSVFWATVAAAALVAGRAAAACAPEVPLEHQAVMLEVCDSNAPGCTLAATLLARYVSEEDNRPDGDEVFSVAMHGSPWRLYDPDYRILMVEELALLIKNSPKFTPKVKKVELRGSWSGVRPTSADHSLAERLSIAMGGFPVEGADGFMWAGPKDSRRTTRQSYTGVGIPYFVQDGKEVMVSAVAALSGPPGEAFVKRDPAYGYRRLGASADIFEMCPDRALEEFEKAAKHGDVIGAYNAALMRLQRNEKGDRRAAIALLEKGARAGDTKSMLRLAPLVAE